MNKKPFLLLLALAATTCSAFAQVRMRDVFAGAPDSLFPLLTRNNRLDCIDFSENGMEARVRNRFDEPAVLDTLTDTYLSMRTGMCGNVEMKLFASGGDTLVCVCRTAFGPAADSEVRVYDLGWRHRRTLPRPAAEAFLRPSADLQPWTPETADTLRRIRSEAEFLPLVRATLSPDAATVMWTQQSSEFSKDMKKVADRYLQPVYTPLE